MLSHPEISASTEKLIRRSGQVLLEDFTLSLIVFGIIFSIVFFTYYSVQESRAWRAETSYLWEHTMNTLNYLITSPGVPKNWNSTTVRKVGLAVSDHVVSTDKILEMGKINYTALRDMLGAGVYNLYFVAEYTNGSVIVVNSTPLEVGVKPSGSYEFLLRADRYVYCQIEETGERKICRVELILWK